MLKKVCKLIVIERVYIVLMHRDKINSLSLFSLAHLHPPTPTQSLHFTLTLTVTYMYMYL